MSLVHWLIVLTVVLLFFGPKRLGAIGKEFGQGIRVFRDRLARDAEEDTGRDVRTPEPRKDEPRQPP